MTFKISLNTACARGWGGIHRGSPGSKCRWVLEQWAQHPLRYLGLAGTDKGAVLMSPTALVLPEKAFF